jgi:hypothetical protein
MNDLSRQSQATGKAPDGSEVADAVSNLASSFGKAVDGGALTQKDTPLLTVIIEDDGKAQMTALSATKALVSGFHGAGAEIPDLGDRAIRLGNLGLNVLKGNTIIRIIPGAIPDGREKSVLVAREILPKL